MSIKELDTVILKDGIVGTIVNVNIPNVSYELDIGTTPTTWDTITITHEQIKRVLSQI